jgi:hypothetical protein
MHTCVTALAAAAGEISIATMMERVHMWSSDGVSHFGGVCQAVMECVRPCVAPKRRQC